MIPCRIITINGGKFMEKLFYPAIFHKAEEGGFWVTFPDIPECITEGDDMADAYRMAIDALGLSLSSKKYNEIPPSSSPESVSVDPGCFLVVIEFDIASYRKRTNSKSVKKTLTIPGWLDEEATAIGINFSQVLQEALIEKLQLHT